MVVAAVVEDTSEHGGTAAGPVVRDIVKAYYDKKEKKTQGQSTAQAQKPAEFPKAANKAEAAMKVAQQISEKKQQPE